MRQKEGTRCIDNHAHKSHCTDRHWHGYHMHACKGERNSQNKQLVVLMCKPTTCNHPSRIIGSSLDRDDEVPSLCALVSLCTCMRLLRRLRWHPDSMTAHYCPTEHVASLLCCEPCLICQLRLWNATCRLWRTSTWRRTSTRRSL